MRRNRDGDQKLFNLLGRFSLLFVLLFLTLDAKESFKNFKKHQSESVVAYKDENEKVFSTYLSNEWKAYKAYESAPLYEKPKLLKIDEAKLQPLMSIGPKISIKIEKKEDDNNSLTILTEQNLTKPKIGNIVFDFFGSQLSFNLPDETKKANFYPLNKEGIVNFFNFVSSFEHDIVLNEIKKTSKVLNLNDWGVYLLVHKISDMLFSNRDNSELFSWYIFNKLGYAVKIGLAKKHVVLMYYSKKDIYSTPYYKFNDKRYYVISEYNNKNMQRVFSYVEDYPYATKELDLSLEKLPKFEHEIHKKNIKFSQGKNIYEIPVVYNKNLIDFMASYPQADYETFFNAPLDDITYNSIAASIKEYLDGKKANEAINFILSFVQKSFMYQRDDMQFKREKVMFAQETLYFDKSDCEDRAVLFSYLIMKLLNIKAVGVKYEDHMTTALYIPVKGDTVSIGSRKFVIADPTYVNASVGMSMPKYKFIKPQSYILVKID